MIQDLYDENVKEIMTNLDQYDYSVIRHCRECIGMKQYKVGEFLGVDQNKIKKLELGEYCEMPDVELLKKLEGLFVLPKGWLIKEWEKHIESSWKKRKRISYHKSRPTSHKMGE